MIVLLVGFGGISQAVWADEGQPVARATSQRTATPGRMGQGGQEDPDTSGRQPPRSQVGPDAQRLFSTSEMHLFLDPDSIASGQNVGLALAATEFTVMERRPDAVRVRITGWQEADGARAIYEHRGQRILAAALGAKAQELVIRGAPVVDPNTDLVWRPISIEVWVRSEGLTPDRGPMWDRGAAMFRASCAECHSSMTPEDYLSNQWIGIMKSMERHLTLDKAEYRFLQKYLQLHASDMPAPSQDEVGDAG